jgi:hypothetical protein
MIIEKYNLTNSFRIRIGQNEIPYEMKVGEIYTNRLETKFISGWESEVNVKLKVGEDKFKFIWMAGKGTWTFEANKIARQTVLDVRHVRIVPEGFTESIIRKKRCYDILRKTQSFVLYYQIRANQFQFEPVIERWNQIHFTIEFEGILRNIRIKYTFIFENKLHTLNWSRFISTMENLLIIGNGKIWTVGRIKYMNNAQLEENLGNNIQLTYALPGGGWEDYDEKDSEPARIKLEMNENERKKKLKETLAWCSMQETNKMLAKHRM